jgi:hypothetical protein
MALRLNPEPLSPLPFTKMHLHSPVNGKESTASDIINSLEFAGDLDPILTSLSFIGRKEAQRYEGIKEWIGGEGEEGGEGGRLYVDTAKSASKKILNLTKKKGVYLYLGDSVGDVGTREVGRNSRDKKEGESKEMKKKKREKDGEKKKPVTAEDLDKDIDTYWYKGGKGPNPDIVQLDKEMEEYMKTKGKYDEELKGKQDKIDANHNDKIDAQDFAILRGKKKVKEGREFTEKLLEMVRKSDVPAYLRKAKGDTPLTVADVKGPKKDSISDPKNLAKNKNEMYQEEVELHESLMDHI